MPVKNLLKITVATMVFSMWGCSSTQKNEEVVMTNEEVSGAETNAMTSVLSPTDKQSKDFEALRKQQMVFFDFDKSRIKPKFRDMLRAHASFLIDNKSTTIQIEGHCDELGTPEYNIALGERRARSVQRYLQSLGVSKSQMSIVSYGEEKPLASGSSEEAYQKNRRAVLVY